MSKKVLFECLRPACAKHKFEVLEGGAAPKCPKCDGGPDVLRTITAIHYLAPNPAGLVETTLGPRTVACNPNAAKLPKHATGERVAVTCPKCLASALFVQHEQDDVDTHDDLIERRISQESGTTVVQQ